MPDVPTIDMREELLGRHAATIQALHRLSMRVPIERWAVVGGLMVLAIGYEYETTPWRASQTKDADVVVDVVADRSVLEDAIHALLEQGFELAASVGSGADVSRCTFTYYRSQIDLLCPSDAEPEMLDSAEGLRSVAIPAGRRALDSARNVSLFFADDYQDVLLRLPDLAGAIMTKAAAAADPRTSDGERHIQDVAFLLSLRFDVDAVAAELRAGDRVVLALIDARLRDSTGPAWDGCSREERDRALIAFDTFLRRST